MSWIWTISKNAYNGELKSVLSVWSPGTTYNAEENKCKLMNYWYYSERLSRIIIVYNWHQKRYNLFWVRLDFFKSTKTCLTGYSLSKIDLLYNKPNWYLLIKVNTMRFIVLLNWSNVYFTASVQPILTWVPKRWNDVKCQINF